MARALDKMTAIPLPGCDWALEGIFARGSGDEPGGALIAPPHPLYGGSMDSPVVNEIGFGCQRAGYATLRFNWRGVGASGGESSGEAEHADVDTSAALALIEESAPGPIVAAGYSFGAASVLRSAASNPRVRRLLLVAPPPTLIDAEALAAFRGRVLVIVGSEDALAPKSELAALLGDGPRRELAPIPDADHFFGSGLAEIGRRVGRWLGAPD